MNRRATVVVVTAPDDATADPVVVKLSERGVDVVRFDTAEFPARATLAASLSGGGWGGALRVGTRTIDLARVKSVWWRRPGEFRLPSDWTPTARTFAASEARAGLLGVLGSLPVRWVNHPTANLATNYKPMQLAVAATVGLDPPATVVTTDPTHAATFARAHGAAGREVIYKALGGGVHTAERTATIPTTVVDSGSMDESIASTAVLLQERVAKAHEVRLTVVGSRMFAAAIHAHSDETRLDFRVDYGALTYRSVPVPKEVEAGVSALMAHFGLFFGALDFAVTPDGRWRFFEINASGQYRWLERHLPGLGITDALVDALSEGIKQ
ncbi:ATP-grasp ribosomal peptide maturase [Embleya sp. NPDC050154]|uniref:ATP-grasp ribosomal peptide maturase n=1 Tax=Embleya sp. NPDC050154 TaxID=3363988 RepID=UPI0037AA5AF8